MLSNLYFILLVSSFTLSVQGANSKDDWSKCECEHGQCAKLKNGIWKCWCDSGYTGDKCDVEIAPCETNPCGNHGTCKEVGNGYYCVCDYGYGGEPCELAKTEPTGDSCSNNLDCTVKVKGSMCEGGSCYCPYNYKYVADSTPTSNRQNNNRLCLKECQEDYELTDNKADFLRFPGKTAILNENDKVYNSVADVEECKQKCIDENHAGFPCRSIEFLQNNICQLNILTISDYSAQVNDLASSSLAIESYERPCVKQT